MDPSNSSIFALEGAILVKMKNIYLLAEGDMAPKVSLWLLS